ncbi:uncharacterized protein K489DRAFT_388287 [Dissoconium aciculare CBS 342.82]|uniref:Uncharacterized protein n=1 Tax=Dissoconium aciculare CBS 342.82 TaxID=1314786 RepID=A0A6J3M7J8_9PEZI|nr:uncharacterized protein K489DRAFT_388287 [Dissoconium aciculare CBS 342.82]KAF1823524.1 hypothetical protein K489DRAFT_388287 [Dissoconium aciculare CBS 342.82]
MSPDINSITTASAPTRDTRMTTQGTSDISLTTVFAAINNPAIPAPGEMQPSTISHSGSPTRRRRSFALHPTQAQHRRQPSLGELHQELENEQEAQVNRLLHMIRLQQDELDTLRRQRDDQHGLSFSATELAGIFTSQNVPPSSSRSSTRFSIPGPRSQDTSPHSMRLSESTTLATDRALLEITRDESAFYQAETQSLTRENQMLKLRIRELGKL